MRRLLIRCLAMLIFLASVGCAAKLTPTPTPCGPPKWSVDLPDMRYLQKYPLRIRIECGTPEEVLEEFKARYPNIGYEVIKIGKKRNYITVNVWDKTKYTPAPTSTPAPIGTPQRVTSYRGVRVGMPADDVLKVWGKGLRSEQVGSDAQGLIVEWVYEDATLIMKMREIGGVRCYRVAGIRLH